MAEIIPFYDRWKLSCGHEDEVIVGRCEHCDGEIYEGEEVYETNEGTVHEECFNDFAIECLDAHQTYAERQC
jgi:hypothetical protein